VATSYSSRAEEASYSRARSRSQVGGQAVSYGIGPNKKIAQHIAANEALRLFIADYDETLIVMPKILAVSEGHP
jgi:dsRNA-specific ribonuclease